MNKKWILLLLALLSLFLIGAVPFRSALIRLTVVNKSGREVDISLNGRDLEYFYYLTVAEGDGLSPTVQVFTVVPDTYTSQLYFVELWDPVYGYYCNSKSQAIDLTHNVRLTVLPCDRTPPNGGEAPSILKYGGRNRKLGR